MTFDPDAWETRTMEEIRRKAPNPQFHRVEGPAADDVARLVVSRDPCPRCGVRGDVGCRHRPKP